ncbi:MAG: sodium:alanine symporter family protein [Desulfohalobiaceae bacterium]|nr:sodium:alanine symporter family protein [Desulfohalobiaceae bacterium]
MDGLLAVVGRISGFVWGPYMLILLVGTGIYLTFGVRWKTVTKIGYAFKLLMQGRKKADQEGEGEITPFQALMTALSATIGTGNIAGVATAIFLGGPGAVFWMWITAIFGMATKFGEAVLAVRYRETMPDGSFVGGPMYYIKNGMGKNWKWLGFCFALFAAIAAFGIGNTVQSNSVARAVESAFGIPYWITGLVLALLTFAVIIGGVKRIARVTEKLVPIMAIVYVLGALFIIVLNFDKIGSAFALIFSDAFTGTAATGGFAGAAVAQAMRFGVARGVFSNEAGLGSAPIAHAAARTKDPVRQGIVGMLGTFIDTICVCTMTALLIIMTGAWKGGLTGAELSQRAFNLGLPGLGDFVVGFGLVVFAFSTMLAWSYYGQVCFEYIFGLKGVTPYRLIYVVLIFFGAIINLDLVWTFSDMMNGLMIVPNLIALLVLSPVIFRTCKEHFDSLK